jgi:inosose dehydratase
MTNAWGATSGMGKGVTSVKDLHYVTVGLTDEAFTDIKAAGFDYIEIFEGNLLEYSKAGSFKQKLENYGLKLLSVYTGGNFIYKEIAGEELFKIEKTCELAAKAGSKYITVGGGAVRHDGVRDSDYMALAETLDKVDEIAQRFSLTACYHPHLGTIVETPEQIRKVLALTGISFCPDLGHIQAAGGDAAQLTEEFLGRISYLHLKDFKGTDFAPLGTGEVDVARVLELIKQNPAEIDCTVEAERIKDPSARAAEARLLLSKYGF